MAFSSNKLGCDSAYMESREADGQPIDVKRTGKGKISTSWKKQSHMQRPYYQSSLDAILRKMKNLDPRDDRPTDKELLLRRLQDWRHQELKLTSTEGFLESEETFS